MLRYLGEFNVYYRIFRFLMMILSRIMIVNPEYWSDGIVSFSKKSWFHPFEIISRFGFGLAFVFLPIKHFIPS